MSDPRLLLGGGDFKMAVTCQYYSRRNRGVSIAPASGTSDSASVLSPTRAADNSSAVSIVHARKRRSSEHILAIKKNSSQNIATELTCQEEGPFVSTKRQTKSVKVKVSKRSSGESGSHRERDIEDAPPASAVYRFTERESSSIRASLLLWYDEHHRVLPWRQNAYSRHEQHSNDKVSKFKVDWDVEEGSNRKEENDNNSRGVELEDLEQGKTARPNAIACKSGRANLEDAMNSKSKESDTWKGPVIDEQRAYEVWVSEMMLLQTRVETVISYYQRWMERWPTLHHLAQASQEEVNTVWAGLGYYRRARFLLEGAKQIVENCSGFPRSLKELRAVPGIGEYSAGAIASIAFQRPVPLVDGNVVRVLSRLRAISENPKLSSSIKIHWALAKELVDDRRPGDLNQSLMELGATVCTPTSPSCSSCPVSSHCKALSLHSKSLNVVTDFPVKVARVQPRDEYVATCVLVVMNRSNLENQVETNFSSTDSHILLVKRPKQGLLAGLWEFPSVSLGGVGVPAGEQRAAVDRYLKSSLGFNLAKTGNFTIQKREAVGTFVHLFSHIRMHVSIERLLLCPSGPQWQLRSMESKQASITIKWVQADNVDKLGLTTGVKKVYSMYLDHLKSRMQRKTSKSKRYRSVL